MEINYQTIINFLVSKNTFSNRPNIVKTANTFDYFKDIFDNTFYRYGVYLKDSNNNNISLINSILYCIDNNNFSKTEDQIKKIINDFINKLYKHTNDNDEFDNIIKENRNNIFKEKNYDNPFLLEIICNYLKINLFIFDFKDDVINSVYYNDFYNPWRPNIFLAKYDSFWEPIVTQEKNLFNYSDKIIKENVLFKDINYYIKDFKEFYINDNFNEILELEKLKVEEEIKVSSDESSEENPSNNSNSQILTEDEGSTFTNKNNLYKNLTKNKLNKMKKAQVIDVLDELEIDYSNIKKPTKVDLITLFLDNK